MTTDIPPTTGDSATPSPEKRLSQRNSARVQVAQRRASAKGKGQRLIITIVERVATLRKVDWHQLFAIERGSPAVASARVLAIGLCTALDVPQFIVAKAFSRNWATIYKAEIRCSTLYRTNPKFRKEWDKLVESCETDG